jgi:uncharacterized integral membrane protein
MKILPAIFGLCVLLMILVSSLLLVLLNPDVVTLDIFGMFFLHQSLGLLILFAFVAGVFVSLLLSFFPAWILSYKNKNLQKRLQQSQ